MGPLNYCFFLAKPGGFFFNYQIFGPQFFPPQLFVKLFNALVVCLFPPINQIFKWAHWSQSTPESALLLW